MFPLRLGIFVFLITIFVLVYTVRPTTWFISDNLLVNKAGFSHAVFDQDSRLIKLSLSSDDKYRLWTPLEEISSHLVKATLVKEDRWFYYHPGVNIFSLFRAFKSILLGEQLIGGSTITMQFVRLRYGLYTRSILGKVKQLMLALGIEAIFNKDAILEAYLNIAPYGGNIEGVAAASEIYFGKSPKDLSPSESITLSVIPQRPSTRSPFPERQSQSLLIAHKRLAKSIDLQSFPSPSVALATHSMSDLPMIAPHLTNRLIRENLYINKIHSFIDRGLQRSIERVISDFLRRNASLGISNASAILIDTINMQVKGYVGSANYLDTNIDGFVDGIVAKRSPGSALKPLIYALGIERGFIHPGSILKDTAFEKATYNPENFERDFLGPISSTDALIRSRNIPAVGLLNQITPLYFLEFLEQSGIKKIKEDSFYGLSLALGGVEVTAEELISLYAMLANGGILKPLHYSKEQVLVDSKRLLSPEASRLTLEMLTQNPKATQILESNHKVKRLDIPWKTGTSFAFRDAWAAGIVGKYALVVWIGNFDGKPNQAFVGRDTAGPLFFSIADMLDSHEPLSEAWRRSRVNIKKVNICALSGQLPGPHCYRTKASWYVPGVSPIHTCNIHRKVFIDKSKNMRTCSISKIRGEEQIFEFWPSDILKLYQESGLPRTPPPPYAPECIGNLGNGKQPLISSPDPHNEYILQPARATIPFSAVTDSDAKKVYWFVDDQFIAEAKSGETVYWEASIGTFLVRVVDEQHRVNEVVITVSR